MIRPRYVTLDHWRGLACLLVLLNHAVWTRSGSGLELVIADVAARGWMGVPIFFVISGYCISAAVDGHIASRGRSISSYFLRRLRRIFPPYWAVLLGTMTIVAVIDVAVPDRPLTSTGAFLRPWWYTTQQWLGNLTLTEMWRPHVVPGQKAMILGHAWTLCYEEQFYVVCGLLLWLVPRRFFLGSTIVTAGVAVIWWITASRGGNVDGFFFDGQWLQFWLGVVLFHVLKSGRVRLQALVFIAFLGIAAFAAQDVARILTPVKNMWQAYGVAAVFAAVALALHRHDVRIAEQRGLGFLQQCGVMCYSLYLVHLPIVNLIHAAFLSFGIATRPLFSLAVCVPVCLVVARWFHLVVERRFLNAPTPVPTAPKGPIVARAV